MAQVLPAERDLRRVIGDADGTGDRIPCSLGGLWIACEPRGIEARRACDVAICRAITDDADVQRAVAELVATIFP